MSKCKFKIGDKLLISKAFGGNPQIKNKIGTVVDIMSFTSSSIPKVGLAFKEKLDMGHDCNGHCADKHGWYCYADDLMAHAKPVNSNKVKPNSNLVLYAQGRVITVKLIHDKKIIAVAAAKCSPDDDFDILVGAQLALYRLAKKYGSKIVLPKDIFSDDVYVI